MNNHNKTNIIRNRVSNACEFCRKRKIKCTEKNNKEKRTVENNNDIEQKIQSKLLKHEDNDFILFDNLENNNIIGNAILCDKTRRKNYYAIVIDKYLIELYFRYANLYIPVISKETVMERIQNKTILPELLLSIYGAVHMFKPNPDIGKALKYNKMALYFLMNYPHDSDVQTVQAYIIISKSIAGTNLCWILFGYFTRKTNILNLFKDNEKLNKRYNLENKLTFLSITSLDMKLSIITGRSSKYDYLNLLYTDNVIKIVNNINDNINDLSNDLIDMLKVVITDLVLSRLLAIVVHYIVESHTDTTEMEYLEKIIVYWFKLYEPIFTRDDNCYSVNYKNNVYCQIFFSTLKILYLRCKSASIISNKIKIPSSIKDNYIIPEVYKSNNLKNKYSDPLLEYCYNLLLNILLKKENTEKSVFNDNYDYQKENNYKSSENIINNFDMFTINNHIYIKGNNKTPLQTDFTNTINSSFEKYIPSDENIINNLEMNILNKDNINLNHSYEEISQKNKYEQYHSINIKRCEAWKNLTKVTKNPPGFEDELVKKVYDNIANISSNSNPPDDNVEMDYQYLLYNMYDEKNNTYLNEDSNKEQLFNNYFLEFIEDAHQSYEIKMGNDNQNAIFENIINPFINLKHVINDNIQNSLNNINDKSVDKDSFEYLIKCYSLANEITENIKLYKKLKVIFDYTLSWYFYETGIIYIIFYVNEGEEKFYEIAKFYENILSEGSKYYIALTPYSSKFREMMEEAKISVQNNSKKLTIKDVFKNLQSVIF
ncbi:hypothetical protein PIROE2DRAFT_8618 [Piromyces sp. E2]|nr:hypothetical protein PIROE2DRAFT_8618 [Piromyces sp. E2]|eukprot:OUM64546.1 hypothetical protein PIROE2DRAFT_8618 [Piromyces sp. E2]